MVIDNVKSKNENRRRMVLAMEMIMRAINDEDVFEGWLIFGVPDGEISSYSLDTREVDDYFIEDENYSELMGLFLEKMNEAYESGGLYDSSILDSLTVRKIKGES